MASIYIPDEVVMAYADAEGSMKAGKNRIKNEVEENAPGGEEA